MPNETCLLKGTHGQTVVLRAVHIAGQVQGLCLRVKVRQTYVNQTGADLEAIYTFPLAWDARLLGMGVELGDRRLLATVIEKQEATERYEKAIAQGDTPVMVEQSAAGLYTANLGNLKEGETAVIELDYAQLLRFEQGHIRLTVPTAIAPWYGDPHALGMLQPHESTAADPQASYPFTLQIGLHGAVASARISSPSHQVSTQSDDQGVRVSLDRGGFMDRDFILNLDGLDGRSFAVSSPDGGQAAVMASFCPKLPEQEASPLNLKILVDCSGSMQGDSIHQARLALHEVSRSLSPADSVSYSRFGSSVVHVIPRLEACTPQLIGGALRQAIEQTQANMGGTELHTALQGTFALGRTGTNQAAHSMLLITDGEVWAIEQMLAQALHSQHRIFAVGLGHAPAESLLRNLAEATGGACELVSPNEDLGAAIVRMFKRMRTGQSTTLSVDWGATPLWQSTLPGQLFDGETVHVFARFDTVSAQAPVLRCEVGGQAITLSTGPLTQEPEATVARLAAACQIRESADKEQITALALHYQLISAYTNLFLIHQRTGEDKAGSLPRVHQVPQMLAAGWAGGSPLPMGNVSLGRRRPAAMSFDLLGCVAPSVGMENFQLDDACGFVDTLPSGRAAVLTPQSLVKAFNQACIFGGSFHAALEVALEQDGIDDIKTTLIIVSVELPGEDAAWAALLEWLGERLCADGRLERHALRFIQDALKQASPAAVESVKLYFAKTWPKLSAQSWH